MPCLRDITFSAYKDAPDREIDSGVRQLFLWDFEWQECNTDVENKLELFDTVQKQKLRIRVLEILHVDIVQNWPRIEAACFVRKLYEITDLDLHGLIPFGAWLIYNIYL